jgi:AcrR family transcriptional regulator
MATRAPDRPPRRLTRTAWRDQLVQAAMPLVAEHGFADFSLEELAAQADVTRNLLYHYFPRGREDIVLAVVERAGRELTDDWVTDDTLPLGERLTANFGRIAEHALKPSDAWLIHRHARAATEPELTAVSAAFNDVVVESVALNHFGTRRPTALARLALVGYLSFAETVLDQARVSRTPSRPRVMQLLAETLIAIIAAAQD